MPSEAGGLCPSGLFHAFEAPGSCCFGAGNPVTAAPQSGEPYACAGDKHTAFATVSYGPCPVSTAAGHPGSDLVGLDVASARRTCGIVTRGVHHETAQ